MGFEISVKCKSTVLDSDVSHGGICWVHFYHPKKISTESRGVVSKIVFRCQVWQALRWGICFLSSRHSTTKQQWSIRPSHLILQKLVEMCQETIATIPIDGTLIPFAKNNQDELTTENYLLKPLSVQDLCTLLLGVCIHAPWISTLDSSVALGAVPCTDSAGSCSLQTLKVKSAPLAA